MEKKPCSIHQLFDIGVTLSVQYLYAILHAFVCLSRFLYNTKPLDYWVIFTFVFIHFKRQPSKHYEPIFNIISLKTVTIYVIYLTLQFQHSFTEGETILTRQDVLLVHFITRWHRITFKCSSLSHK